MEVIFLLVVFFLSDVMIILYYLRAKCEDDRNIEEWFEDNKHTLEDKSTE